MIFEETKLAGAYLISLNRIGDARGFFARAFCHNEFADARLISNFVQCNVAWNSEANILRGMHMQLAPHAEAKLVRCTAGAIYDVIVDMRPESATYLGWQGFELTSENRQMVYVPHGFAHGYLTLAPNSEIFYQVSEYYTPTAERGVRWNDPQVGIEWPVTDGLTISDKDAAWPLLEG